MDVPAMSHQRALTGVHVGQVEGEQLFEENVLDRLAHVPARLLQGCAALIVVYLTGQRKSQMCKHTLKGECN